MAITLETLSQPFRKLLPKSLFARALLILVIPTVLVQLLTAYFFFERHWDNVTRHMSGSLAGEVTLLVHQFNRSSEARREEATELFGALMGIEAKLERNKKLPTDNEKNIFPEFERQLNMRLTLPFVIAESPDGENILIGVQLNEGVLHMRVSIKRLASSTTSIFLIWMVSSAAILLLVAILFMRNQIRPISRLAEAAESFGKGHDSNDFRPHGAMEVRRAARAFMVMKERIKKQIATRVEMLAGISHDLRTPLTRMKLQLAMLPQTPDVKGLQADVAVMERMIQEYLDFARGAGREETSQVSVSQLLSGIVDGYRKQNQNVTLTIGQDTDIYLREHAITRALSNIIDNALRYGTSCTIKTKLTANKLEICIDDEGPGIAAENRSVVFRPFTRLETSRNQATGGVGLGLTIARDIVLSHGGEIILTDVPDKHGLRVVIRLPL